MADIRFSSRCSGDGGAVHGRCGRGGTGGRGGEPAPGCVQYAATWRYTHVTNACDTAYRLTVEYPDGTGVPCREAQPGATVTFPGYGPGGNGVLRVRLCPPPL
ncbi:alpha-amylase [Streptomyces sp. I6]|uniref:alpha-amylase n=1 Tax=Streptomyces sp. I6 TaxID=2483113 RepID=UPI0028806B6C|nr:alpha-amylase [Streptomyces sp. I6]